jgi:hypothetical protein
VFPLIRAVLRNRLGYIKSTTPFEPRLLYNPEVSDSSEEIELKRARDAA